MSDTAAYDPSTFDFASASRTVAQIQQDMKDVPAMPGRTHGQLTEAFELVKPKPNWKMPIRATLPIDTDAAQLELIEDAVIYFTGGVLAIERTDKGVILTSDGYYENIGS